MVLSKDFLCLFCTAKKWECGQVYKYTFFRTKDSLICYGNNLVKIKSSVLGAYVDHSLVSIPAEVHFLPVFMNGFRDCCLVYLYEVDELNNVLESYESSCCLQSSGGAGYILLNLKIHLTNLKSQGLNNILVFFRASIMFEILS